MAHWVSEDKGGDILLLDIEMGAKDVVTKAKRVLILAAVLEENTPRLGYWKN